MKQFNLIFIAVVIAVLAAPLAFSKVTVSEDANALNYHFSVDGFTTQPLTIEGRVYYKYVMKGVDGYEGVFHHEGSPELPVIRLYVDGEGEILVQSEKVGSWDRGLQWPIAPALPPSPKRAHSPVAPWQWNVNAYELGNWDTDKVYEIEELGMRDGVKRRLVTLYPLQQAPAPKSLELLSFKVRIPKVRQPNLQLFSKPEGLAIVLAPLFESSPSLKLFIEHKERLGYRVSRISLSGDAKDLPKKIRTELRLKYLESANNLKHVLIIGSNSLVPGYSAPDLKESKGVTDHFYRCLDIEDYEKDINTPDVSLGRFSALDEKQLSIIVEKAIRYEQGHFADPRWLKRASFIATDDVNHWHIAEGSHRYTIDGFSKALGWLGSFPEKLILGGDRLFAVTHKALGKDVLSAMKDGRGFINYSGHGLVEEWETPNTTKKDILELNHEALPVVIANACDTAQFVKDSFAEAWQRHTSGSIVYIGSMDTSYWGEDAVFQTEMAKALMRDKELVTHKLVSRILAEIWRYFGSTETTKYYWEIYATLGDPTLLIRTAPPEKVKLSARYVRKCSETGSRYAVVFNLSGLRDARVAMSDHNIKALGAVYSNDSGVAVVPLAPELFGTKLTVSVSGKDLEMVENSFVVPQWNKLGHEEEQISPQFSLSSVCK